jgi:hypothetical protein
MAIASRLVALDARSKSQATFQDGSISRELKRVLSLARGGGSATEKQPPRHPALEAVGVTVGLLVDPEERVPGGCATQPCEVA